MNRRPPLQLARLWRKQVDLATIYFDDAAYFAAARSLRTLAAALEREGKARNADLDRAITAQAGGAA